MQSVPIDNLFPQIIFSSHRLQSVGTAYYLWEQITRFCSHRLHHVPTDYIICYHKLCNLFWRIIICSHRLHHLFPQIPLSFPTDYNLFPQIIICLTIICFHQGLRASSLQFTSPLEFNAIFRDGFPLRVDLNGWSKIRNPVTAKFKHVRLL